MATQGTEKHYRIIVLLSKCGTQTTRRLLCKHVEYSSPNGHQPSPWTIDNFISHNRQSNLFFPNGKERYVLDKYRRLMFPTNGQLPATQPTDIEEADILLLCNLLIDACNPSSTIKLDLEKLKKIRNKICHTNDASLSDDKYDGYSETIEVILDRFLVLINDDDLTADVHKQIKDVKDGALMRLESSIGTLDKWHKSQKDISKQIDGLQEHVEAQSKDVKEMKELLEKYFTNNVPDTKLIMVVKNCNSEQEEFICHKIIALVNPSIQHLEDETKDAITLAVKEAMKTLLSEDLQLQTVKRECIAFYLKCPSIQSLLNLWINCTKGEFTKAFQPVEKCVRSLEGCSNVRLQVLLPEREFIRCLNLIVTDTVRKTGSTYVHATLLGRRNANYHHLDNTGTAIELDIKPTSISQRKRILQNFDSNAFTEDLQRVALAFEECHGVGDVIIDAQLVSENRFQAATNYQDIEEIDENPLPIKDENEPNMNIFQTKTRYQRFKERALTLKSRLFGTTRTVSRENIDKRVSYTLVNSSIHFITNMQNRIKRVFRPGRLHKEESVYCKNLLAELGIERERSFLAFLLYSHGDSELTTEFVYKAFNDTLKESLHLNQNLVCDYERNFMPGMTMINETQRCIDSSDVMIVVWTESYLESAWCNFEASAALDTNKPFILIINNSNIKGYQLEPPMKNVFQKAHLVYMTTDTHGEYSFSPALKKVCDAIITYAGKCRYDKTSKKANWTLKIK